MQKTLFAARVAALVLCAASPSQAEESGPTFTFGASTSFVYDINEPDRQNTGENQKAYADGESEESFNIDLVQLGISGSRDRVTYGAKVDFGDWADAIEDNIDGDVALQEMFIAVDAGFGLISAGRMPTPIGYEVVEPWANPNISRSRAWFYQPISHDGAAVSGEIGGVSL
ncbi:MAG: outer membrane beta-barrel protein, partial [Candidatus Binatia bacterium]